MILTVFKAGNSKAVTIPKQLADKLGFEVGTKVEPYLCDHSIAFRPIFQQEKLDDEFGKWLDKTAKKYGPVLAALAKK